MDQRVYQVGATALVVGLGAAQQFKAQAGQVGWQLQVLSGGSSGVALMQATGVTASQGYILGTQVVQINGPAQFYLCAQGSTAIVSALVLYGPGFSLPI